MPIFEEGISLPLTGTRSHFLPGFPLETSLQILFQCVFHHKHWNPSRGIWIGEMNLLRQQSWEQSSEENDKHQRKCLLSSGLFPNQHGAYQLTEGRRYRQGFKPRSGLLGLLHPLVAKKKIVLLKILVWSRWKFGWVYISPLS